MKLNSKDPLTQSILKTGICEWSELINFVKTIPYGRNTDRADFSLVIKENKGTCSSKHAFLKEIADLNRLKNVRLILAMYEMNEINTPKTGNVLSANHLTAIPEAHCYLKVNNSVIDATNESADFSKIKEDILEEIEITPQQIVSFKVAYHKKYLKNWIQKQNIPFNFDALWEIREQCIENLTLT